jgi:O-antigen/teichoic acid export membrane protein
MSSGRPGLWRPGLHTLGVSVISVGVGFGQSVLIARALGDPTTKGGYDLSLATASLVSMVLGLSLPIGATYAVARGRANPGTLAMWLLGWSAIQGVITVAIVLSVYGTKLADVFVPADLGLAVIVPLSVLVTGTSIVASLRNILIGQQRIIPANNGDMIGRFATPVAMVGAVATSLLLGSRYLTLAFLWCVALGMVVTSTRFLWLLRDDLRQLGGNAGLRVVASFSMPAYASNLVQFLNYRLDLFLVSSLVGLHAVGIYALAVSIAQLLWLISQAAATVLLPRVASEADNPEASAIRSAQIARLTLYVTAFAAVFLGYFGHYFIPIVYGAKFGEALDPFLLLLPGVTGFAIVTVLAAHIAGRGRPSVNLVAASVALVVTLALDLTLIPAIGVPGAAIASSASYLTSAVVTACVFWRMTGISPIRLLLPTNADVILLRRLSARLREAGSRS